MRRSAPLQWRARSLVHAVVYVRRELSPRIVRRAALCYRLDGQVMTFDAAHEADAFVAQREQLLPEFDPDGPDACPRCASVVRRDADRSAA